MPPSGEAGIRALALRGLHHPQLHHAEHQGEGGSYRVAGLVIIIVALCNIILIELLAYNYTYCLILMLHSYIATKLFVV